MRILDLGCGTGMLAHAYARRGHSVTGVDAAAPMLAVAKLRDDKGEVDWVLADARSYRSQSEFDLIIMTGHVFQFLVSDDDVQAALSAIKSNLAPDGRLVFETRNPAAKAWTQWNGERTRRVVDDASEGRVEIFDEVLGVDGDVVEAETHYQFSNRGETIRSRILLRFLDKRAVEHHLSEADLAVEKVLGDWHWTEFDETSAEMIFIARHA